MRRLKRLTEYPIHVLARGFRGLLFRPKVRNWVCRLLIELEDAKLQVSGGIPPRWTGVLFESFQSELERGKSGQRQEFMNLMAELRALRQDLDGLLFANGRKIKVRFFVQYPHSWTSIESVWKAFSEDTRCDAKMIALPFLHDSNEKISIREFLVRKNVAFCDSASYDLNADRPDVVFYQSPYDSTRPEAFHVENVARQVKRIVYIPYGLEIGGGAQNMRYMFNLPIHRIAWRIFARSERHKQMFGRYCERGNDHVVVSGHPKFDALMDIGSTKVRADLPKKLEGRKVILWNPHFSTTEEMNFSTFMKWKDLILSEIQKRSNIALVIRPHPLMFQRFINLGIMTDTEVEEFRSVVENSENIVLDEGEEYIGSFHLASALMSDTSSFLLEFLPTGKPILHLKNVGGIGLNDDAALIETYYPGVTKEDVLGFIGMVTAGSDPKKQDRLSSLPEYLFKPDGRTGLRIKEEILQATMQGL